MAGTTAISLAKTVMEGALSKLTTTAADEIAKMLGVREEVWYIRGELEMMQSFLMVAEAQQNDNSVLRTWFRQVKDLAYQIEDCLEEFSFHLENRDLCYKLRSLCVRRRIASDIRSIKAKVQEVSQRNLRYNLIKPLDSRSDITSRHTNLMPRMTALVVEETEFQSKPKSDLIKLITENSENKKVIWVVGMGGLGKTTLTKKVFDDPKIKNHFKNTIWITVSQNFDEAIILKNIIKQISSNRDPAPERIEELREYVKSRLTQNYLVVLDDLWSIKDWNTIEYVFPDLENSYVVVTTRNRDVAKNCSWKFKQIYPLEHLSYQDSFSLFLRKINKTDDFFENNKHMKDVIDKIIKKCRGLPLAIVTTGGLLASKPVNKKEWEKVLTPLGPELDSNPSAEAVKQILDLSYTDLPYHLKPCLLYLSIFPEDHEIKRRTLVCRWIAEGYVREKRGMTLEEAPEEYFFELINRSLIQPFKIGDDGTIKSCRIHDIMRELIVSKSIDENLISIVGEGEQGSTNCRHLVVLSDTKELEGANLPHIRSVSIFGIAADLRFLSNSKFRLLRVVELRDLVYPPAWFLAINLIYTPAEYLGTESLVPPLSNMIAKRNAQFIKHARQLVHLKYLGMEDCNYNSTLDFGNFRNLQTLEIDTYYTLSRQTVNIAELKEMRHFRVNKDSGVALGKGIRNLKMLQSLACVDIRESHPKVMEELTELHQLRELALTNLNKCDSEKFSTSFSRLGCLRSLRLCIEGVNAVVGCLDSVSSPPEHLRSIKLEGRIEKLPTWFPLLSSLTKITLWETRLGDDGIAVLQKLPSLVVLRLYDEAYVGEKLIFEKQCIPKPQSIKTCRFGTTRDGFRRALFARV